MQPLKKNKNKKNHATSKKLYLSYYPHLSRELVSPVSGIFHLESANVWYYKTNLLMKVKVTLLVIVMIRCSSAQCSAVQYSLEHYSAVQCSAVQFNAVQFSAVKQSLVQFSAV